MDNKDIKKLRETFKDVIESSMAFAKAEENLECAVITSFLIGSPKMEASEDDMSIVLRWANELAGKHSVLSLFLMGLITVKVENGQVMCAMVDPEKSDSCWGNTASKLQ